MAEGITYINLSPRGVECYVCGAEGDWRHGLTMYEDQIVDPDVHEWGGQHVCPPCIEANEHRLGLPILPLRPDTALRWMLGELSADRLTLGADGESSDGNRDV